MSLWIIIGRFNPLHLWHMKLIEKWLEENKKTLIIIWSANICDTRNPFDIKERKTIISSELYNKNIVIDSIDDTSQDLEWFDNLKKIIEKHNFKKTAMIFYCWDIENDYAIKVIKENEKSLKDYIISYKEISRKEDGISATMIRNIINSWNIDDVYHLIPKSTKDIIHKLKK